MLAYSPVTTLHKLKCFSKGFLNTVCFFSAMNVKTVDTIGNCQSLVFTVGVSQHMHNITNLWILSSIDRRICEILMKEKTPLSHNGHTKLRAFRCLISTPQILNLRSRNQIRRENYFFLENYVTSEGAVSHNVLYYQPLPITRYQLRFYADNYFE